MEYLDQFTKSWNTVDGINRVRHCLVPLDGNRILAIGGFETGTKVELYDPMLEEWIELPDINAYSDRLKLKVDCSGKRLILIFV
jgi:hypothetical protein